MRRCTRRPTFGYDTGPRMTPARKPSPYDDASSEAINAMIEHVAPAILKLLADGVPRRKDAIVKTLAGRHAGDDVALALIRLAVTEQVSETAGKYVLAQEAAPDAG